jgi:hypothetical protein
MAGYCGDIYVMCHSFDDILLADSSCSWETVSSLLLFGTVFLLDFVCLLMLSLLFLLFYARHLLRKAKNRREISQAEHILGFRWASSVAWPHAPPKFSRPFFFSSRTLSPQGMYQNVGIGAKHLGQNLCNASDASSAWLSQPKDDPLCGSFTPEVS